MKRLLTVWIVLGVLACMAGAIVLSYNMRTARDYHAVQIGWTTEQVREAYGEPQQHQDFPSETTWKYKTPQTQEMRLVFYDRHIQEISVYPLNTDDDVPLRIADSSHPDSDANKSIIERIRQQRDEEFRQRLSVKQPIDHLPVVQRAIELLAPLQEGTPKATCKTVLDWMGKPDTTDNPNWYFDGNATCVFQCADGFVQVKLQGGKVVSIQPL